MKKKIDSYIKAIKDTGSLENKINEINKTWEKLGTFIYIIIFKRCLSRTVKMATVNHSDNLEGCLENEGNSKNKQKNHHRSGR